MVLTEQSVRDTRQRVPSLSKRLKEALSLALWLVGTLGGSAIALLKRADASAARATERLVSPVRRPAHLGALRPTDEDRPPRERRRWRRTLTHVVAAFLVFLVALPFIASPILKVASRPLRAKLGGPDPWRSLEQPSTVVAAGGTPLATVDDGIVRQVVALSDVPEVVRQAVVAAEDKRFWSHRGYDAEAVGRAFLANTRARRVTQGASTITQQLAKQNFVGDAPTFLRKSKELLYAVALEERFTKDELLERYLNQVYFGSGAYGIAAAAQEFFGADVGQLSADQAALLAGLIRAPAALDPRTDPDAAMARRNDVLRAMAGSGSLAEPDATAATAAPLGVIEPRPADNPEPFVVEAVKREFLANPVFGATEEERRRLLDTGGLRIETTVDPALQAAAKAATRWVPESLGSALVAVDPRSGRVRALHDGGTAADGQFDVATQGGRQPGSTFKPLVAAAALEAGMPEWQVLAGNGPIELTYPGAPEPWQVDNFDEEDFGLVDLREAVVNSVNTAFAQLGVALGADRIADMATRLGIDPERSLGSADSRGPSLALGGLTHGVSPLELASAYATFAAGGVHIVPHLIEVVTGPDGREIYRAEGTPRPALDGAVTAAMVDILQEAVDEGTGSAASLPGWEVLGKTGTSDGPADGWFVGAVPVLSAAVWVGRPDSQKPVPGLTGGSICAPIWRAFMAEALRGQTPLTFSTSVAKRTNVTPLPLPQVRQVSSATSQGSAR